MTRVAGRLASRRDWPTALQRAEPCVFRLMAKDEVSLMVGVHVDNIIVLGVRMRARNSSRN